MLNESMVGPLERWLSGQGEEARKLVLAECQKEAGANLVAKLREVQGQGGRMLSKKPKRQISKIQWIGRGDKPPNP